jgi:hypothetical protein
LLLWTSTTAFLTLPGKNPVLFPDGGRLRIQITKARHSERTRYINRLPYDSRPKCFVGIRRWAKGDVTGENHSETTAVENATSPDGLSVESFDGGGFAGYLAPYALAALGSIAATVIFVKFVLMDY